MLYFSDTVYFFEPGEVETYAHPGITLDLFAGAAVRACYTGARLFGASSDYDVHIVENRFFYFGLCSFLTSVMFVACCWPLFLVCKNFVSTDFSYALCTLFLISLPNLLYINRFSPEPYMLFFGLASINLSLKALDGGMDGKLWLLMGCSMALSLFAKPLMLPVLLLNAYALLVAPVGNAVSGTASVPGAKKALLRRTVLYFGGLLFVATLLIWKLPVAETLANMKSQVAVDRFARSPAAFFWLPDQAPFALQNTRRPDWHYYFGFYWALLFFAGYGLHYLFRSRLHWPEARAVLIAPVALILVINIWRYPGVLNTFKHYRDRYIERRGIAKTAPCSLPAVWEKSIGNSDLSDIWPVHSRRLQATLERLRSQSATEAP
jgi:hypothetical protein